MKMKAVGRYLSQVGIAVRSGHHCAQPILRRLGYESTVRPSLAFYNTPQEIDFLGRARRPVCFALALSEAVSQVFRR
nr:cysteine desulfurase, SufS family [Raoultella sp. NCTC 9187]